MYKQMIPADAIAREAGRRVTSGISDERSSLQTTMHAGNEDALVQNELAEWKERCLRLAAEFDNFKRRTAREDAQRAAEQKNALVRDLLPVVDNLERALGGGPAQSLVKLRDGIGLTLRQLTGVLNQHGFTSRDDRGQPFDPQFHEAVGVRTEPTHTDQVILDVWQRGWLRGKELFRPAKVVVNDLKRGHCAGVHQNTHNHEGEYRD
jgi:molecular chaperone GrpE